MDLRRSAAAVAASAILFYFGTGLSPVAQLTWVAPLPILLLAPRVRTSTALIAAFVAHLLGTTNSWAFQLRSHDVPFWPMGLMIDVGMSLVFTASVWAFRRTYSRPLLAAFTAPAVWTGALYVVSVSNPAGMMGTFANHQAGFPLVMQTAALTGMWGVEFLVMFVPCAIAAARPATLLVATGVLGLVLVGGAIRMDTGPTRKVATIATNQHVWAPDVDSPAGKDLISAYADEISKLPDDVTMIVLPEQTVRSTTTPAVIQPLINAAHGRTVVVGVAYDDGRNKFNYAVTADQVYLKQHDSVSPRGHDLVFPDARTGVVICADVNFPAPTRDYANAGTEILAIPASDEDTNGWQHSRTALIRGVENGQAVVWSDRTGESMISDGWGRVVASAHTGGNGPFTTLVADVPIGPGATAYTSLGDWFAWLCLALAVAGLVVKPRRAPLEIPPLRQAESAARG
ncbi:nitrilase-related carbon-nitrogen hydrolase [Actinocrispum wychmicini]|uniref:Apolipoprotein N-acyltransferase n=1 Tax=Actinocrispum wychmicini TaxID=1213861 RepID=A0A4R2JTP7_9PSEU|nr:nitrilase-related carbon-nitrogen hydrolase [Actinocrispum wychmicini]TCO62372.1 apolipoprotein N-acyltransferase [Actinocrispum wychmicini]